MEASVWTQLFAQVANFLSSLFASSSNPSEQSSGGVSANAPAKDATLTSTSKNVTTLDVIRDQITADGIFGSLKFNGGFICYTLENRALAIPAGQYGLEIYDSPHAGHPVPRLQNVFGRSELEIHCGNRPEDSKGCILVGLDHKGDTLERSRDAFSLLFPLVSSAIHSGVAVQLVLTDSYTS